MAQGGGYIYYMAQTPYHRGLVAWHYKIPGNLHYDNDERL